MSTDNLLLNSWKLVHATYKCYQKTSEKQSLRCKGGKVEEDERTYKSNRQALATQFYLEK